MTQSNRDTKSRFERSGSRIYWSRIPHTTCLSEVGMVCPSVLSNHHGVQHPTAATTDGFLSSTALLHSKQNALFSILKMVFARSRTLMARSDVSSHMVKWWKGQVSTKVMDGQASSKCGKFGFSSPKMRHADAFRNVTALDVWFSSSLVYRLGMFGYESLILVWVVIRVDAAHLLWLRGCEINENDSLL